MHPPVTVIMNAQSGSRNADPLRETILDRLRQDGREVTLLEVKNGNERTIERAVIDMQQKKGIVLAAGGDGTVNGVAALCHKHQAVLAVIPLGTFNYFARMLAIPADINQALDVVITGSIRQVSAGFVQDHIFLNNASFGLYTRIIRNREADKARFGRLRLVAVFSAVITLFKGQKLFTITITKDGHEYVRHTNLVFVGNNSLQLENIGMQMQGCETADELAVIIMKPASRSQLARILWRGAIKNLKEEEKLEAFCADSFRVTSRRRRIDLVIDGEIIHCAMPLAFRAEKAALRVMAPVAEAAA